MKVSEYYGSTYLSGADLQGKTHRLQVADVVAEEIGDTVVIGISPDLPKLLAKFTEKQKLNFTLLSDPDHAVADKYGVWGPKKFMGREYDGIHRMSFIIDKEGKLRHIMEKVNTKTHHDDVVAWVDENLK